MSNELIINSTASEIVIALLSDKRLIELHREKRNNNFSVGDIYLGRIKKLMPGLNAAFVDVGYEKDAFLHYLDLGPQIASQLKYTQMVKQGKQKQSLLNNFHSEKDIDKSGKISDILTGLNEIVIQIAKEPISTKGPRITSEISLAGRFIVLVPFSDRVSVSQKIKNHEEKDRLKKIISGIKPKNFGIIVRTVAENKTVSELEQDLQDLLKRWDDMYNTLKTAQPPFKILGEIERTNVIMRDMLNDTFSNIVVNDESLFEEIKNYLQNIAPDKAKIVKHYKGKDPIFDYFGVDRQMKSSFGRTVNMKSGAYLIVEHTEAMHVIDVNSGHRSKSDNTQEKNALEVNIDAAVEVARQLRLRDMGGIVVVDFIDMHESENRKILYEKLKDAMKGDKAKHNILPPSKFGLIQITRERVRPQMQVETTEKCPVCNGTGEIEASILILDEIENNLRYIIKEQNIKKLSLHLHPFLASHLTKGLISQRRKWSLKYKCSINVKSVSSYHFMEYHFFDKNDDEIKT